MNSIELLFAQPTSTVAATETDHFRLIESFVVFVLIEILQVAFYF